MNRFRWPFLVFLICLPVALLAYGYRLPLLSPTQYATVEVVPEGDYELAWFQTTTGGATWERFVAGVLRASANVPGLAVDDSRAFADLTTSVPELVLHHANHSSNLRIRWYKLSGDHPPKYWLKLLAARSPAPLAIIGGGTSDRARDMAWALARQGGWKGERPLFFITTATAEKVHTGPTDADARDESLGMTTDLLKIYDHRSFRFCFNNRQMAEAIVNFLWQSPTLRPRLLATDAASAITGTSIQATPHTPTVFYVDWDDDPYSSDLIGQFRDVILGPNGPRPMPHFSGWQVPFSIGGFSMPNQREEETADAMLKEIHRLPPQRSILVIPTVAAPARRFLRTLAEASPGLGRKLVAINGDGMGVNTILRDGEFAWPVRAITVPLVLFTHNNPMSWDSAMDSSRGYSLLPPNSTEDVLHTTDMMRTILNAIYHSNGTVANASELAERLRSSQPIYFDELGNRRGGVGEYLLVVVPQDVGVEAVGVPDAMVEVWTRRDDRTWQRVERRPIIHSRRTEPRINE